MSSSIGCYAFIGAGVVVIRDIPDPALAFGNPDRTIGWMCRYGEPLYEKLCCRDCGLAYQQVDPDLRDRSDR